MACWRSASWRCKTGRRVGVAIGVRRFLAGGSFGVVDPDHEHGEPVERHRRALRRERGRRGLRDCSVDGRVDRFDELMSSRVEPVDRSLRLCDGGVVHPGTASLVFQVPLVEVAGEQIEEQPVEATRRSVCRVAKGTPELRHHLVARREMIVR